MKQDFLHSPVYKHLKSYTERKGDPIEENQLSRFFSKKTCLKVMPATFLRFSFTSKREHLWNKEKRFLFYLESSFRSWNNQILTF